MIRLCVYNLLQTVNLELLKLKKSIFNLRKEPCDFQGLQPWSKHLGTLEETGAKTHFVILTRVLNVKEVCFKTRSTSASRSLKG